jgi:hypothetical protein
MGATVKIQIKTYWGKSLFECDVDASLSYGRQLGAAVKAAFKSGADLSGAVLSGADLSGADLSGAVLSGAVLRSAVLSGAVLSGAVLRSADLRSAVLRSAVLSGADLSGADLSGAVLSGAVLRSADLKDAKNPELAFAMTSIVPQEGAYVAWKKCAGRVIVKLLIPAEARRSNASGRKCRAEFADVLEVFGAEVGVSQHDGVTEYKAGQRVYCDKWDENRWEECSGGIHHFITRIEAENY